jgi:hypothetical protein
MPKNRIQIDSKSNKIKVGQEDIGIVVDSSDNRIKSKTRTQLDFTLPVTNIFDSTFGGSFN